tara:strand:- start:1744 stop:2529 length:786 start_codon:yes stop_codon:yes gene_type:complete
MKQNVIIGATLLSLCFTSKANAETEELHYELTFQGQQVGERVVSVRWLFTDDRDNRIITSWTDFSISVPLQSFSFQERMSGLGGMEPMGFTSSLSENGRLSQIQMVSSSLGWNVNHARDGVGWTTPLPESAIDATSMTLVDPGAAGFLDGHQTLRVLSAESGTVISGTLENLGEQTIAIDGTVITSQSWVWHAGDGDVHLYYGEHGHLLKYTVDVYGQTLDATLLRAPSARSYEDILGGTIDDSGEFTGSLIDVLVESEEL